MLRLGSILILLSNLILPGAAMLRDFSSSGSPTAVQPPCELVILSKAIDPYHALAEEIAAAENAPLVDDLPSALACQPVFLLWVVSPDNLSDAAMIELGKALRDSPFTFSPGIITASSLEGARELWQRRTQVQGAHFYAANAPNPAAHIDTGQLLGITPDQTVLLPLTKTSLKAVLAVADYLTFTGHGGSGYLRLDETTKFTSADLPYLDRTVVATGSCQTFRPWNTDSIARRFVDRGAAAYAGFVFGPNEGYLIGEFDGLPFRYTWSGFPVGNVVQVQSRGTLQGFAHIPYLFLLGDPRIALQSSPPYRMMSDRLDSGRRTITFYQLPAGAIPLRIAGGAAYDFVEALGITSASQQDLFYNSRLQMINIRADKYLLVVHNGGDLTLRLRPSAPWYWYPIDILLDSLDHTYVFSQQSEGDFVALGFAVIPLLWTGWQLLKKRLGWPKLRLALALGAGAALLHLAYVLARLDEVTITSKMVAFSPLSVMATLILAVCGTLIFIQARSLSGEIIAILVITFIGWSTTAGGWLAMVVVNRLGFIPKYGVSLYNYAFGLLPLASFLFTVALITIVFSMLKRSAVIRTLRSGGR